MRRILLLIITTVCLADGIRAQEAFDLLSYAMGDYFTRSMQANWDKNTQQIMGDREEYIRGFADGLNAYKQKRTAVNAYYDGQSTGLFFLMSINWEPQEDDNQPHLDCIIEGLRKVADNTVVLPQDTIGAHQLLYGPDDEAMLTKIDADTCRLETIMGILFGLRCDDFLQQTRYGGGDTISIEDQQAFAAGMADVLENSEATTTYDMGRSAAQFFFLENMRIKQLLGLDFDYDAIIDGARAALELTERRMSVEEVEMCLIKYYESQYDAQATDELDNFEPVVEDIPQEVIDEDMKAIEEAERQLQNNPSELP